MINNQKKLKKHCLILLASYVVFMVCFFTTSSKQLKYDPATVVNTGIRNESYLQELENEKTVSQISEIKNEYLDRFEVTFGTFERTNLKGQLQIELVSSKTNTVLFSKTLEMTEIKNGSPMNFLVEKDLKAIQNENLILNITAHNTEKGSSVTIFCQNSLNNSSDQLLVGNEVVEDMGICSNYTYLKAASYSVLFVPMAIIFFIVLAVYFYKLCDANKKGKDFLGLKFVNKMYKYQFLMQQLVERDFKTKYKRSILGVFWSVLNPLLTMAVQYAVFSQLFRYQVENYPVYLLTGTVIYSAFTDATNQGIYSIINNASLITKVYVPKNIYPISKVLSSFVNLLFSFIPLLLLAWFTGLLPKWSYLMIPYGIICLIIGAIGLAYILSALMVFFRDVQFLWSLFTLMWMYATPIFYPIDILPKFMRVLMNFNPMYYFVEFFRTILIDRVTPDPLSFVVMALTSLTFLAIGNYVFKKLENKFALYI